MEQKRKLSPDEIEARRLALGRACGKCALCCKLLKVEEAPAIHEAGVWCSHARPGCGGCAIYANRPRTCREFTCSWLIEDWLPLRWYPPTSRMIIVPDQLGFRVTMAEHDRDRWREEPYYSDLQKMSRAALAQHNHMVWTETPGKRGWLILPGREVKITKACFGIVVCGPGAVTYMEEDDLETLRDTSAKTVAFYQAQFERISVLFAGALKKTGESSLTPARLYA